MMISTQDESSQSVGIELLRDIQEIFDIQNFDRIGSAELIQRLCDDEEKPWATFNRGASISPRQIAKRLKDFGISSHTIRLGFSTAKGYLKSQFTDAFARYLTSKRNTVTSPSLPPPDVTDE